MEIGSQLSSVEGVPGQGVVVSHDRLLFEDGRHLKTFLLSVRSCIKVAGWR